MLDGILLESRGIPAVAIVTDGFIPTGRSIARLWGVPDYAFVHMPHPLSSLTAEEIGPQAAALQPLVLAHLTRNA